MISSYSLYISTHKTTGNTGNNVVVVPTLGIHLSAASAETMLEAQ